MTAHDKCPKCGAVAFKGPSFMHNNVDFSCGAFIRNGEFVPSRSERIKDLTAERDRLREELEGAIEAYWYLRKACEEGGSHGRPMDMMPKKIWAGVIERELTLHLHADDGKAQP